jgi:SnoaL-like domain
MPCIGARGSGLSGDRIWRPVTASLGPLMDSTRLAAVKAVWQALEREGVDQAVDVLVSFCRDDAVLSPYAGEGRVFEGVDEFRSYMREVSARSSQFSGRARSFSEDGDTVDVFGQIRVRERDGRLREAQVRWCFQFDHADRIVRVTIR